VGPPTYYIGTSTLSYFIDAVQTEETDNFTNKKELLRHD